MRAYLYIIVSGLCFLVVNFFVKILGAGPSGDFLATPHKIPAHELVLFRSIISFSISYYFIRKKGLKLLGNNRKWLFVRGMAGMIALTLFFFTIHHLPIAIASTIQYLAPFFTITLAVFIVKEKIAPIQWLFVSIALIGVLIIGLSNQNGIQKGIEISWFWIGIGIISAIFSALAYNSISKLKETEDTLNIVVYFPMLALPIMSIWCMFEFVIPQGLEWIYLLLIGVFTQIAQVAMTKAFQEGNASSVAPFQFLGSIYALLVGYFLFDERLDAALISGITLILIGVVVNAIYQQKKKEVVQKEPTHRYS